jgi:hypothetical protein
MTVATHRVVPTVGPQTVEETNTHISAGDQSPDIQLTQLVVVVPKELFLIIHWTDKIRTEQHVPAVCLFVNTVWHSDAQPLSPPPPPSWSLRNNQWWLCSLQLISQLISLNDGILLGFCRKVCSDRRFGEANWLQLQGHSLRLRLVLTFLGVN